MPPAPTVGWFGRTFGWSGSREQWLILLGFGGWLAGAGLLCFFARNWSIGQTILALAGWLFVLIVAAREALRDLFGPVFFYDLLRLSRNRTTFLLRGIYVVCLAMFLALMYYAWLIDETRDERTRGQFLLFSSLMCLFFGGGIFWLAKSSVHVALRALILAGSIALAIVGLIAAIEAFSHATHQRGSTDVLPPRVISRFATNFFETFVVLQFIVISLLTPVYVAGTIAVEKERKTLEFLLATDLRNREIVFGKLASRILTLVMYVLAALPIFAFMQLFGGIDPELLLATTTATITLIFGLSALSIWVSATLRRARDAIIITYLLAVGYGFISLILVSLTNVAAWRGWWNTEVRFLGYSLGFHDIVAFFADGNPVWAFAKYFNGTRLGMTAGLAGVLREFVVFWALAIALLLGSAILKVRRVALQQTYGGVGTRRKQRAHPLAEGPVKKNYRDRDTVNPLLRLIDGTAKRPSITGNPVTWKETFVESTYRGGCLGQSVAFVIVLLLFVPLVLIWYYNFIDISGRYYYSGNFSNQWYEFSEAVNAWARVVTGVLGFLLFMSATVRGAGAITGEKDRDTWTSLMSTPLSSDEILLGKWWGCILSLRRGFAILLVVWAVGLATGSIMPGMMIIMLLLTAVYVSAFSWVGLYISMTARTTLVASVRAFFAAIFCAGGFWVVLGLCCFMPMSFERGNRSTTGIISSFFCGFTPPLVYGIFPLRDLERRDLGPFHYNTAYNDDSAGLAGPIAGTLFWIGFSLLMWRICSAKFAVVTNRARQKPRHAPRESDDESDAEASS